MSRFKWNSIEDNCQKASIEASTYIQMNTQSTGIKNSLQKVYGI